MTGTDIALYALSIQEIQFKPTYRHRIWTPARIIYPEIGSRRLMLDQFARLYDHLDRIFVKPNQLFVLREVHEVFTDEDNRWFSFFIEADETGQNPARYLKHYERLQMIGLYVDLMIALGEIERPQPSRR